MTFHIDKIIFLFLELELAFISAWLCLYLLKVLVGAV